MFRLSYWHLFCASLWRYLKFILRIYKLKLLKMKTSSSQFDLLVTYMEQHGDITKPTSNARGRITCMRNWEELAQLLNSDGSGDTKSTEKWKKVWSDFKNNTKKKAARLHKAASGTGGGPAVYAKLSDLEQRVLNLIGVQVATGLPVEEAGLSQGIHTHPQLTTSFGQGSTPLQIDQSVECSQHWNEPGPSTAPNALGMSPQPQADSFVEVQVEETGVLSPTRPSQSNVQQATSLLQSRQTTPRRVRPTQTRGSPRRRVRPAHTEQAAQQFLQAEEFWRSFKMQQHKDYMEMRREQHRIRALEVQALRDWQALGSRALDIIDKLVNKYC